MSMDRSLKARSSLVRHRNVLNRAERIQKLMDEEKFEATKSRPIGLPKVGNRKVSVGGKSKKAAPAEGEAAPAKK
ncbi:MAG: small basic protein [Phycisphaerae bacterium]|nr:small basic protein [Phycisphaerae bacterium]